MGPQAHHTRIALFGGSFNPPHLGHRQVVEYLCGLEAFDEIWIVPAFDHPFEKNLAPYEDRVKMCGLFVQGTKAKVSRIEEDLAQKPSYMIDTLRALKKKNPGVKFSIVVGSDIKPELEQWKDIGALKKEAEFFFIPRAGIENSPFLDISSTEIRKLIREGKTVAYLIPTGVMEYIKHRKLYA